MAKQETKKVQQEDVEQKSAQLPFTKKNYIMLAIGLAVIVIGFVLMSGGGSADKNVFDYSMFSFRRITLAPILVLAGFGFEIFAIMKRFDR